MKNALDGGYALAYRITASTLVTYFIDAHEGHVLMEIDEKRYQSAVGVGQGVLGDTKKISATQVAGGFEARDQLRPADIVTLDVRGLSQRLERLQNGTLFLSRDLATDADNTWTNPGVVDTHVHMGWTFDYLFKQHSWVGLDDQNRTVHGAVASFQAGPYFVLPPFGPVGRGLAVFGTTSAGTPIATLDVVAHELMHGVTHFGVSRRNIGGLTSLFLIDGLGPQGLFINGVFVSCPNVVWVFPSGLRVPFLCSNGRFVLASDHGGATHESFSDIFGTSVEFFFQQRGGGPLGADYLIGEDIPGIGVLRSLRRPASFFVDFTRRARYPDHYTKRLRFGLIVSGPERLGLVPLAFDGTRLVDLSNADAGGVHWNSTVLSHAFYLAIEGGRNNTSGRNVRGVGAANRAQIERVFFRAVTELMPEALPLPLVADVIRQAVRDLFPLGSREKRAVFDALGAVGL